MGLVSKETEVLRRWGVQQDNLVYKKVQLHKVEFKWREYLYHICTVGCFVL